MKSSVQEKPEGAPEQAWFVVETGGHAERLAKVHLQRQGFEVYLPMRAVRKKTAEHAAPFFPRYLFVRVTVSAGDPGWALIRSTVGVRALVKHASSLVRIPDVFIAALRAREHFGLVQEEKPAPKAKVDIAPGAPVRVTEQGGAWSGFDAIFVEQIDARRVAVLLSLFGRSSRVQLPLKAVRKAALDAESKSPAS